MASLRKQRDSFRSGRIKGKADAGTLSLPIIQRAGAFRIYNSGKSDFDVKDGTDPAITVPKKCSLDLSVSTGVIVMRADTEPVDGIYELMSAQNAIRGGRFRGVLSGDGFTIVKGAPKGVYRILNSGRPARPSEDPNVRSFRVCVSGADPGITLKPRFSIDVGAGTQIVIKSDEDVEGIYDYLDDSNLARSGRFRVKLNTAKHKIIDLSNATGTRAHYRILNSGEEKFRVRIGENSAPLTELDQDQSFDFSINFSVADKDVWINPSTANKIIQGIYEFQGIDR